MTVTFYTYTGHRNAVTKSLSGGTVKSGNTVPGYQDISAPVIQVSNSTVPGWNYCYITDYNKYYFLSAPRWVSGNVYEYQLTEDVLTTHDAEIRAQSGLVRYSLLGSMGIRDPRISFETKKRVTVSSVAIPAEYQTAWYVIRYFNQRLPGSPGTGGKIFSAAFMDAAAWNTFLNAYAALTDRERVIVGNCIIDVSLVRYLNTTAVQNLTTSMYIDFVAQLDESILGAGSARVTLSADDTLHAYICKDPANAATLGTWTVNIPTTTTGMFWELEAEREIYLPYVGAASFRLADMGITTPSQVGLRISYDPYENAYITMLAPVVGSYTNHYPTIKISKVDTAVPFRVDTNYTNMGLMRFQAAASIVSGAVGIATLNPMAAAAIPQAVGTYDRAQFNEQTGYRIIGQPGGDPAYTSLIDGTAITVTVIQAIPRDGYTALWADKGIPDGAWRDFSTLSGYAEIDEVELTGVSGGLNTVDEIARLLSQGVYF